MNKIPLFIPLLFLISSCSHFSTGEIKEANIRTAKEKINQSLTNQKEKNSLENNRESEKLNIEDIDIEVKIPGISGVEKKVLPAEILENESDKPGRLHPRCIAINFKGNNAEGYGEDEVWFPARIIICPVDEYPKILEKSNYLVKDFQNSISILDRILLLKPKRIDKQFAIIDYIDAEPAFFVNLNYASFRSGEGFFVMTQYIAEPTAINNRELKYIFQGFTTDKKYYVLGTFPVKSKHLSDEINAKNVIKGGDDFDEYIIKVKKLLKDKSSFTPKLEQIEETVKSLKIR